MAEAIPSVTPTCYLQEDDPPEDHDIRRLSAVCGRCYSALDEMHKATIERLITALLIADRDIGEWVQLANRQREILPQVDHHPGGPSQAGIERSGDVRRQIGEAISFARSR